MVLVAIGEDERVWERRRFSDSMRDEEMKRGQELLWRKNGSSRVRENVKR